MLVKIFFLWCDKLHVTLEQPGFELCWSIYIINIADSSNREFRAGVDSTNPGLRTVFSLLQLWIPSPGLKILFSSMVG